LGSSCLPDGRRAVDNHGEFSRHPVHSPEISQTTITFVMVVFYVRPAWALTRG
jgi:hypothetical protein